MTRNGKIARLSLDIREELNKRLQNGEPFAPLLEWLNGMEGVKAILAERFKGKPITEQNLSDWKCGGYVDWELKAETERLRQLHSRVDSVNRVMDGSEVSECMARMMAVEMTSLAASLMDKAQEPEERWKRLCQVHEQLSRMRRDDHRSIGALLKWDQRKRELAIEKKRRKKISPEERDRRVKAILATI